MGQMKPGTYRGRIVNYELSYNSKGNPQVEVLFEYTDGEGLSGTPHQIRWWGQLTGEKAPAYTLKALQVLGFKGKTDDDFARLADGVEGGMLDLGAEFNLVLEERNKDGKTSIMVKYINDPNFVPGGFKNAMSKADAKVKLGALNLAGQMAMIRQEMGAQAPKPAAKPALQQQPMGEPGHDDDDFDFGPA